VIEFPGRPPDRAYCRSLGHLPRRVERHPLFPGDRLETCLRCGATILHYGDSERDVEVYNHWSVLAGEVRVW